MPHRSHTTTHTLAQITRTKTHRLVERVATQGRRLQNHLPIRVLDAILPPPDIVNPKDPGEIIQAAFIAWGRAMVTGSAAVTTILLLGWVIGAF